MEERGERKESEANVHRRSEILDLLDKEHIVAR
jgi:hypothetical protein